MWNDRLLQRDQTGRAPSSQPTPCSFRPGSRAHGRPRAAPRRPPVRARVRCGRPARPPAAGRIPRGRTHGTLEKAVARHRRVPGRQRGRGGREHTRRIALHEAQGMAELDRQQVAAVGRHMAIDQVGRGGAAGRHGLGQHGDQGRSPAVPPPCAAWAACASARAERAGSSSSSRARITAARPFKACAAVKPGSAATARWRAGVTVGGARRCRARHLRRRQQRCRRRWNGGHQICP